MRRSIATPSKKAPLKRGLFGAACLLLVFSLISVSGCGGSSSDDEVPGGGTTTFAGPTVARGKANRPVARVTDPNPVPLANAPVTLIDFPTGRTVRDLSAGESLARTAVVGETDAEGNYVVTVEPTGVFAVAVNGMVEGQAFRSSGLLLADRSEVAGDFNGVTDVACGALIGAINRGEVDPATVTQTNIDILERAAEGEVESVDFTNPDSVAAAGLRVLESTSNGTVEAGTTVTPTPEPTPEPTATPSGLNCQTSETTCADGFPICAELVCNGTVDCADGSDEDPSTCSEEASCCAATNGCPGETSTSCADECCCCGIGEICDQANFANGCVAAPTARVASEDSPLSKLIETGVYY